MGKAKEEKNEPEQSSTKNKKEKISKVIKTTWKVLEKLIMLAVIFVCIIILTQKMSDNEKAFLGFRIFRVQTGSMIPKYNIGDVILVKETEIDKIEVGDDVTYWGTSGTMKGRLVTHRVIELVDFEGKKAFYTQGIANTLKDPIVYGEQINGVVQGKLYILSGITRALANQYIFYFCGIIPLTAFVFFAFVKSNNKKFDEYK